MTSLWNSLIVLSLQEAEMAVGGKKVNITPHIRVQTMVNPNFFIVDSVCWAFLKVKFWEDLCPFFNL